MTSYKVIDLQGASAGVVVDGEWVPFKSAVCTVDTGVASMPSTPIPTYAVLCIPALCTEHSTLHTYPDRSNSRSETVLKTAPTPPRGESDGSPHPPAPPITRVTFSS